MNQSFPPIDNEMLLTPATYFISDMHLSDHTPEINASFYAFLEAAAPKADAIYILGDFLDAWVGDDTPAQMVEPTLSAIASAAKQTKLFYLHGNRDFLLGKKFIRQDLLQLVQDPCVVELYDEQVMLCHGDHLCTFDVGYQRYRRIANLRSVQWLFLSLPLRTRLRIAGRFRKHSANKNAHLAVHTGGVNPKAVVAESMQRNITTLIHGHTHRPKRHEHPLPTTPSSNTIRWVLGCWSNDSGVILRAQRDGTKALLRWNNSDHALP